MIIGGGFAGLQAARSLARTPVDITLIDRRNHHLFQPLLYQVATAALSPANIAAPIRRVLRKQKNVEVLLAEVTAVDLEGHRVRAGESWKEFDYLLVATGVSHSYFGHDDWAPLAPGLKTVEDALEMRRRFLLAFEAAERVEDPAERQALLTFLVVGAGPTGVELAGAMAEITRKSITRDFRSIDTSAARILLFEAQDRVLPEFPVAASEKALRHLEEIGVRVRLGERVDEIDEHGVLVGEERIDTKNVFWAAGVRASSLGAMLGAEVDRAGRVHVEPDLSVPGHARVFVAGDLAHVPNEKLGMVPGMAPGALQMGAYVGRAIKRDVHSGGEAKSPPFRYWDKGMLATIGRNRAVASLWGRTFGGMIAWLLWASVHIFFLIGFRNRVLVALEWAWMYVVFERGARLIVGNRSAESGKGS